MVLAPSARAQGEFKEMEKAGARTFHPGAD